MAFAKHSNGELLLAFGKPSEALEEFAQARELYVQVGALWNQVMVQADLARAYLALRRLKEAYEAAQEGLRQAEASEHRYALGEVLDALGRVEVARHDWTSASQHFNRAIRTYRRAGNRHWVARSQRHLAQMLLKQGKKGQATRLLRSALATFRKLELQREVARTEEMITALR